MFRTQLRAILRAAALGDVRIMFPLVSTLTEFRQARDLARRGGRRTRRPREFPTEWTLPVGIMVEVPATAIMADRFAEEVDFFSIGTNDLIQYTLAVDRTNETVAGLYNAADPSVLRLIAMVIAAAASRGLDVTVCGAIGGEPLFATLLLGMGVRQLSMPPHQLPEIKRVIRAIRREQAERLASEVLHLGTAGRGDHPAPRRLVRRLARHVSPGRSDRSGGFLRLTLDPVARTGNNRKVAAQWLVALGLPEARWNHPFGTGSDPHRSISVPRPPVAQSLILVAECGIDQLADCRWPTSAS